MIGLFFVGMGVTFVGFLIAWFIINRYVLKNDE
jgi:phage shock protein PspC (stress-responsive transcriptional regulator)